MKNKKTLELRKIAVDLLSKSKKDTNILLEVAKRTIHNES